MTKPNASHVLIPLAVFAVAAAGGAITSSGMAWYRTIKLPPWTPSGAVIGAVWTTIFALAAVSAIIAWNGAKGERRIAVGAAFVLNGAFNVLWSQVFFGLHWMGAATAEAAVLWLSVIGVIAAVRPVSRLAAALLVPYAAWVVFATYLTYAVWRLNA